MLPAFGWQAVLTQWEFAPVVTAAVVLAAALYLWGMGRVARRHPARPWPAWRAGMFLGGLALVVIATESGIGAYDDVLFWDHMIQHLMLIMIAPAMLVVGQPVTLLLHASRNPLHTWVKRVVRSRVVSLITAPLFGLLAYAVTIVATHLTGLMNVILTNQVAHDAEHVVYLVVGYIFFLPLIGREPIRSRIAYPVRLLILVLAMPVDTFTGLVLGYKTSPFVTVGPRPPGAPSPLEDVHLGGAVMWIGGDAIMLVFMMAVVLMWSREDRGASLGSGWLESARTASFEGLIAAHAPAPTPAADAAHAGAGDAGVVPAGTAGDGTRGDGATGGGGTGSGRYRTIDDDEHLAAYNAYLARLNGTGPGSGHDS